MACRHLYSSSQDCESWLAKAAEVGGTTHTLTATPQRLP